MYVLRNCTTGEILARRVARAANPWSRLIGFLRRVEIEPDEGLWFDQCSAVHTIGMRVPIDVVFLDRENTIVRVIARAPRHRIFAGGAVVASVLELGAGVAENHDLLAGDRLSLE